MRYGLIGEKLGHSFSKDIHERLSDYTYDLITLSQDQFTIFMQERNFNAINVTIPYKKAVLPYLDELDDSAKKIGAVNTIVHRNGKLIGYNTDYYGFDYMLKKHNVNLKDKKVIILGNGGASAAIQAVISSYPIQTMIIVNRTTSNHIISYEECYEHHRDAHIMINTTPVGMYPNNDGTPIDISPFSQLECVIDLIYNPLYTNLCVQAKSRNLLCIGGLEMLIAQAKYAVEHFKQISISDDVIDDIYRDMLKQRVNIALIGMPSCGKSTIAKELQKHLPHQLIELDAEIVKQTQMSIPQIFETLQEEGFRTIESNVCKSFAIKNGQLISTGGGIIKKEINMRYLQQNSMIIYLDRDFNNLIYHDQNRPLSSSKEAVSKLYQERHPLYLQYCDVHIHNNDSLAIAIQAILDAYQKFIQNM